ncbi:CCA tRNA nucleotidyltransferase [Fructilactobacillus frigidiflavus]|uniref:CCA tRNA nucleotidyltransferase n=1 Tax=Fructilactobacillus frigidiflavus TaxID=3242688 RepID=UPI003756F450
MKIENLPSEFIDARKVLQVIEQNGFEAYFVGGSVRDTLLNLPIHDVDMATSAYPAEIKKIFKRTIDTGIEHGTVTVMFDHQGFEITTFRTESGYQDFRRPDKVTFIRSLKEDLKRRDFTINAFAMKENGEVIDLFNGRDDLNHHLIRAVGDANQRFNEDALRMMRAVRFGSQLNFEIEAETFAAIQVNCHLLEKIAIERINVEFIKMMLGLSPSRGLQEILGTGLFKYVPFFNDYLPELKQLSKLDLSNHLTNETQVWSLLANELNLDQAQIRKMMKAWKCSNKMIDDVLQVVRGIEMLQSNQLLPLVIYQIGLENLLNANQVMEIYDKAQPVPALKAAFEKLPIKQKNDLEINGGILIKNGFKPGPQLGKLLSELELIVINGKIDNNQATLIKQAQTLANED